MSEVRSLNAARADRSNDNSLMSPVECLEAFAREVECGETPCDGLLILRLNRSDGDEYDVGFRACNMQASEMLALLESAKVLVLQAMGLIPE